MRLIRHLDDFTADLRGGAVSVGNFDGVHLGHARIIDRLIQAARVHSGPAIAFTFDPHPAAILRPDRVPPPLTNTERKAELLGRLGVDAVVAYPTDTSFLELTAREFFDRILVDTLDARAIVEGPNFFFGHDRRGNVEVLGQFCAEASLDFEVVEPYDVDGRIISSSRTRQCLAEGHVEEVAGMLTEPYRVHGMVVHGANQIGRAHV